MCGANRVFMGRGEGKIVHVDDGDGRSHWICDLMGSLGHARCAARDRQTPEQQKGSRSPGCLFHFVNCGALGCQK